MRPLISARTAVVLACIAWAVLIALVIIVEGCSSVQVAEDDTAAEAIFRRGARAAIQAAAVEACISLRPPMDAAPLVSAAWASVCIPILAGAAGPEPADVEAYPDSDQTEATGPDAVTEDGAEAHQ